MKIFCIVNISKPNYWLVICIAKNLIWTTLKMIFSIFRCFCTLRFQIFKYCPIITNHGADVLWCRVDVSDVWCVSDDLNVAAVISGVLLLALLLFLCVFGGVYAHRHGLFSREFCCSTKLNTFWLTQFTQKTCKLMDTSLTKIIMIIISAIKRINSIQNKKKLLT